MHEWLVVDPPQLAEPRAGRRIGNGLVDRVAPNVDRLDPWVPDSIREPAPALPPFVDSTPLTAVALGDALLALREEFPMPSVEIRDKVEEVGDDLLEKGAAVAVGRGLDSFSEALDSYARLRG